MIFQALYELAQREELVDVYERVPVAYRLKLGEGGRYLGLSAPRESHQVRRGQKRVDMQKVPAIRVPKRPRRSGTKPIAAFLVDNPTFVFGKDPSGKFDRDVLRDRQDRFLGYLTVAQQELNLRSLEDILAFLRRPLPDEIADLLNPPTEGLRVERTGELFAFVHEPTDPAQCVHEDERIYSWFSAQLVSGAHLRGQCLVTGQSDAPLIRLHGSVKRLPPRSLTGGGVPLTSTFKAAFQSYGMGEVGCAPISVDAGLAVESALNRLISHDFRRPDGALCEPRSVEISSDTLLLFWSREEAPLDWFREIENEAPEKIAHLLRAPFKTGHVPIDDPTAFYALILSGAKGRAIVRSFVQSTVAKVARAIDRYREEVRIVRPYGEGPGSFALRDYRRALVPRRDLELLPPALATDLYLAIVLDRPFPQSILQTIVRRNRVEFLPRRDRGEGRDDHILSIRCSLLKAWLTRNRKENISVALDRQRTDPPYRLGRLLATIDHLQQDALGNVNATLVDRYYGSASSTPESVFPTLLRRSQHHLGKLRREKPGLAVNTEKLLQEIVSDLPRFPKTMTLEDQGLFALGFYHQRQDFFTKKEEKQNV